MAKRPPTCCLVDVDVDGETIPIRVRGEGPITDEHRQSLAEMVRTLRAQGRWPADDELDQRVRSLEAERMRPVPPPPPLLHSTCGWTRGRPPAAAVDPAHDDPSAARGNLDELIAAVGDDTIDSYLGGC